MFDFGDQVGLVCTTVYGERLRPRYLGDHGTFVGCALDRRLVVLGAVAVEVMEVVGGFAAARIVLCLHLLV